MIRRGRSATGAGMDNQREEGEPEAAQPIGAIHAGVKPPGAIPSLRAHKTLILPAEAHLDQPAQ